MNILARDYTIERYANKVIGAYPPEHTFAGIELQGVRCVDVDPHDNYVYAIDNESPESFSVYLRRGIGTAECVGDFTRYTDALQYALELSDDLSLEVHDMVKP